LVIQGSNMSGRPAQVRQRELKQAIIAAQKVGARQVQVNLPGGASIVIPLCPDDKPDEPEGSGGIDL
jgi:hypothetical protein